MRLRVVIVLFCFTGMNALASHHGWSPVEAFSNADGTLQFVEMTTNGNGESSLTAAKLDATNLSTNAFKQFTIADLSSSSTAGKSLLIATSGFEAVYGITPDFIIEDNFLTMTAGDVWYNQALTWSDGLPIDGWQSYATGGVIQAATPKNFSGDTVTLTEPVLATTATQYLMTKSTSANITTLHIVNTSDEAQSFTGTLYNGDGEQQGSAEVALHIGSVASKGRIKLTSGDLETLFGVPTWNGPAMLEVQGTASFSLMSKLISPSGLVSNTNCVREARMLNIEGADSADMTYVRFINTSSSTISNVTGTLYDANGAVIGTADSEVVASLAPKEQIWVNRNSFQTTFGAEWNGEAMLEVGDVAGLKLLNLNFVNGETFFNFSCFETSDSSDVYLMTTSTSANISNLHIVNTSSLAQSFSGTLYNGSGVQQGEAGQALHAGTVASKGRVILNAADLEAIFGVSAWSGPALLDVSGGYDFELMIKLESPSGLISNTNCVRQNEVHNIEGADSQDMTFVRFINIGDSTMSAITGTLYDLDGNVIGTADTELVDSLAPKEAVWRNRNNLVDLFGDTWNGEALLKVSGSSDLRLLNLNFANSETFFNFSCYESSN
ncbi:MAG: hypothetical protein HOC70_02275 [Gammaproteobacteria bacterium]|nr:hypothetical protein [Gammaproteobacteria bacterium]MBT4492039.1 hypothetical protein [Gammaproteobacteria bacterium]MBT7370799.1 hypothetical protein [Gammaproteobacteria bacterium]